MALAEATVYVKSIYFLLLYLAVYSHTVQEEKMHCDDDQQGWERQTVTEFVDIARIKSLAYSRLELYYLSFFKVPLNRVSHRSMG